MSEVSTAVTQQLHRHYYPFIPNLRLKNERRMIVLFSGVPGSGITTLARQLEKAHHGVRVSTDEVREIIDSLHLSTSEEQRQKIVRAYIPFCFSALANEPNRLIIFDANVDHTYPRIRDWAHEHGYELFLIELSSTKEAVLERLRAREDAKLPLYTEKLAGWLEDQARFLKEVTPRARLEGGNDVAKFALEY